MSVQDQGRIKRRIVAVAWAGFLGLAISMLAGATWTALGVANLRTTPSIPWSAFVMAGLLWLMWQYLGGRWAPRSTAEARRRCLRARPVTGRTYAWTFLAGGLAIIALAGYWIVLFQLVPMRANTLPDLSKYPLLTVVLGIAMGSLVSPFSEEAGLRGYCQVILEREFRGPAAVVISSLFFALGHAPLHGFLWPKLLVYFLVGLVFGATAYLTHSILPAIPVHILGDVTFFTLVWPHDAARRLVWQGGADAWFWLHVAQAVVFTALTILAFRWGMTSGTGLAQSGREPRFSQ
jgi:membrane protease YdiL (CAAX protease family)